MNPGSALHHFFNKDTWNSLSKTDQALIENISDAEYLKGMTEYYAKNGQFLQQLQKTKKVKFRRFNDTIYQALAKAAKEVYAELASDGDALTKATMEEYFKFQKVVGGWSQISDSYYVDMRTRLFDS